MLKVPINAKRREKKGKKEREQNEMKGRGLNYGMTPLKSFLHRFSAFTTPSTLQGTQSFH